MGSLSLPNDNALETASNAQVGKSHNVKTEASRWRRLFRGQLGTRKPASSRTSTEQEDEVKARPEKWSLGVLNDKETEEVPGEYPTAGTNIG